MHALLYQTCLYWHRFFVTSSVIPWFKQINELLLIISNQYLPPPLFRTSVCDIWRRRRPNMVNLKLRDGNVYLLSVFAGLILASWTLSLNVLTIVNECYKSLLLEKFYYCKFVVFTIVQPPCMIFTDKSYGTKAITGSDTCNECATRHYCNTDPGEVNDWWRFENNICIGSRG